MNGDDAGAGDPALRFHRLDELSALETHDLLKLRFDIFVLEQRSLYPEIDGRDRAALHGLARLGAEIVGAIRIFGPGGGGELSFGRVAVRRDQRGAGLGARLVAAALARMAAEAPGRSVRIGAQKSLESWYGRFGFRTVSGEYDDGGVAHVDMALTLPE